jgi:acyl-CoA synthetase (AMP-forming)/AMP-acid ligase II
MRNQFNPIVTSVSTIGDLLLRAAVQHPSRDAIVFPAERVSYSTLYGGANRVARSLRALGVGPGNNVGLLIGNETVYLEAFFAIALLGAVIVPLNVRHRSSEIRHVVADARLVAILTSGAESTYIDLPGILSDALGLSEIGPQGATVWLHEFPYLRFVADLTGEGRDGILDRASFDAKEVASTFADIEELRRRVRVRDPGLIIYTSGTTAKPKGCVLTHEAVTRGPVERALYRLSSAERDVTWAAGPLFHIGSLAPLIGSVGACGTFLSDRYFEPGRALALMQREKVTLAWPWFSAIVQGLIDHPDFSPDHFSDLRFVFLIAPEPVVGRVQDLFPNAEILQACGMTETAGVFALSDPNEDRKSRATTQGRAAPGIEVRVVDPELGQDCAPDRMGELWVRGYCVMSNYFGSEENTRSAFAEGAWLKTGDLYSCTSEGSLIFGGRLKDMIKVGGENVATMEVEAFLCNHPAVRLAEVIGIPDARLDEVPFAFVELHDNAIVTSEELIQFCRGRIANYKVPRGVTFVAAGSWPMSATKVDKRALRALATEMFSR